MALFAHHAEAFLTVEIYGRRFPDGMTEHALVAGLAAAVVGFMAYGLYAAARDLRARRRRLGGLAGA